MEELDLANNHDIGSNTNELLQEGQRLGSAEYATRDSAFQGSYEIRDAKMWEPGERSAVEDFTKEDNPMFGRIVEYDDETKKSHVYNRLPNIPFKATKKNIALHAAEQFATAPIHPDVYRFAASGAKTFLEAIAPSFPEARVGRTTQKIYGTSIKKLADAIIRVMDNPFALPRKQTGEQLFEGILLRHKEIYFTPTDKFGVKTSMAYQKAAFHNFESRNKQFIMYDLEGSGSNAITQYAFALGDAAMNSDLHTKEMVSGLIGYNDEQYRAAMEQIDVYERKSMMGGGKDGIAKKDWYMLRDYIKYGMYGDDTWHKDESTGRLVLDHFASNQEADDVIRDRVKLMREGVEQLHKMWLATKDDYVDFGNHRMSVAERDIAEALVKGRRDQRGLTMVTTNGFGYDIGQIERYAAYGGPATEGFKSWLSEFTNHTGSLSESTWQLDVTAIGRGKVLDGDYFKINKDAVEGYAAAFQHDEYGNSAYGNQQVYLGKEKAAEVQKAIEARGGASAVKHTSPFDTMSQVEGFVAQAKEWMGDPDDRRKPPLFAKEEKEVKAGMGSLFLISDGSLSKYDSSVSFKKDALMGALRFAGGVRVDGKNTASDIVNTSMKKNTLFMLTGTAAMSLENYGFGKEILESLVKISPDYARDELVVLTFAPYRQVVEGGKRDMYYRITTADQARAMMQANHYAGQIDRNALERIMQVDTTGWTDEQWTEAFLNPEYIDAADISKVTPGTKDALKIADDNGVNLKHAFEISEKYRTQDSAANWLRTLNYSKASKILKYLDASVKFAMSFYGMDRAAAEVVDRSQLVRDMRLLFEQGAESDFARKYPSAFKSITKTFRSLLNEKHPAEGYSETLNNLFNIDGFSHEMAPILRGVVKSVDDIGSGDINVKDTYFSRIYEEVLSSITNRSNQIAYGVLGTENGPLFNQMDASGRSDFSIRFADYGQSDEIAKVRRTLPMTEERRNTFSIDITSILRKNKIKPKPSIFGAPGNIFNIELGGYRSFGKQLANAIGLDGENRGNQLRALHHLGALIVEQYGSLNYVVKSEVQTGTKPILKDDGTPMVDAKTGKPFTKPFYETKRIGTNRKFGKWLKRELLNTKDTSPEVMAYNIQNVLRAIRASHPELGMPTELVMADVNHAPTPVQYYMNHLLVDHSAASLQDIIDEAAENITSRLEVRARPKREKRNISDLADEITQAIFARSDAALGNSKESAKKILMEKYGFSENEAERRWIEHNIRKRDTSYFFKQFLGPAIARSKGIAYEYGDDGHFALLDENGARIDLTKYVPMEYFNEKTGEFKSQVGGRNLTTRLVFSKNLSDMSRMDGFGVHSLIYQYAQGIQDMMYHMNAAKRTTQQRMKLADYFARKSLDPIVSATFTKFNEQDKLAGRTVDMSRFFARLGMYSNQDGFKGLDLSPELREVLNDLEEKYIRQNENISNPDSYVEEVRLSTRQMATVYGHIDEILAPLMDPDSTLSNTVFTRPEDARYFAKYIANRAHTVGIKHQEDGILSLTEDYLQPLGELGPDNRHINAVLGHAKYLDNVDAVMKSMDEMSPYERDILFGSTMLAKGERERERTRQDRNSVYKRSKVFRTMELSLTDTSWQQFLIENDDLNHYDFSSALHTHIDDSGSILDGVYGDFLHRNIEQRIKTNELMDEVEISSIIRDKEKVGRERELRRLTNELIQIAQDDGSIHFSYAEDDMGSLVHRYVERGDTIAINSSYRHTPSEVKADRAGFLKKRYYNEFGDEVSPEEINDILNRDEYSKQLLGIYNSAAEGVRDDKNQFLGAKVDYELRSAVAGILADHNITQKYAVESLDGKPAQKIAVNTEKSFTTIAKEPFLKDTALRLIEYLHPYGGSPDLRTEKADYIVNNLLSLKHLAFNVINDKERLNAFFQLNHLHPLADDEYKEVRRILLQGRASAFDTLNDRLQERGLTLDGTNIHLISNLTTEEAKDKHGKSMLMHFQINDSAYNLARAYASMRGGEGTSPTNADFDRALEQIRGELAEANVFRDKYGNNVVGGKVIDGSFDIGRVASVDKAGFRQIMGRYNQVFEEYGDEATGIRTEAEGEGYRHVTMKHVLGDDGQYHEVGMQGLMHYNSRGKVDARMRYVEIHSLDDADEAGINNYSDEKGIKATRRLTAVMEQDMFSAHDFQKLYESMTGTEKAFGDYDSVTEFNTLYDGLARAVRDADGSVKVTPEKGAVGRRVNEALIQNLHQEIVAGTDFRHQAVDGMMSKEMKASLERSGINPERAQKTIGFLGKKGFTQVGEQTVRNAEAYNSGKLARDMNIELQKATSDAERDAIAQKYLATGVFGQEIISIDSMSLADQNITDNPHNLTERAGIVHVGDHRYVAVGFESASVMDNREGQGVYSRSDLRDKLSGLQNAVSRLKNDIEQNPESEERQKALAYLDKAVNETINAQAESLTTKRGAISALTTGYLPESATFKMNVIRFRNDDFKVDANFDPNEAANLISANNLLKTAKIDGKSIYELELSGQHVNAAFAGRDYFANMIYNEEFQTVYEEALGHAPTDAENRRALETLLKKAGTEGTVGFELRWPAEYHTSAQATHIFYNPALSSNQLQITEQMAVSQAGDQDGDTGSLHAVREETKLDIARPVLDANGVPKIDLFGREEMDIVKRTTRLNSLAASTLQELTELGEGEFTHTTDAYNSVKMAAHKTANATLTGVAMANTGGSIDDFHDKVFAVNLSKQSLEVDGKEYSILTLDTQERHEERERLRALLRLDRFQSFVQDNYHISVKDVTLENLATNNKHAKAGSEVEHATGIADAFIHSLRHDGYDMLAEEVGRTVGMNLAISANEKETASSITRETDTGLSNMDTYRFRTVVNNTVDQMERQGFTSFEAGDREIIDHVMENLNDAFQASKNSTNSGGIAESMTGAMRDFFGALRGRRNTKPFYDIIRHYYDNGIKELAQVPHDIPDMPFTKVGGLEVPTLERVLQAFDHIMPQDMVMNPIYWNQMRVGYANTNVDAVTTATNRLDLRSTFDEELNSFMDDIGMSESKLKEAPFLIRSNAPSSGSRINFSDSFDTSIDVEPSMSMQEELAGTFRSISKSLGKRGPLAMLGFAGATMMAGIMGGAPTAPPPAQGQAKGIQSDNAIYEIPSTVPNVAGLGHSQPQSYIININASTSRGRDFATNAINQAMAQMPQTAGGNQMTMNIKDSSSNIGFGDIRDYISSML